jgi:Bacterial NAD-glutamate dehydrogenase
MTNGYSIGEQVIATVEETERKLATGSRVTKRLLKLRRSTTFCSFRSSGDAIYRANDILRAGANQLRCKVIGEGDNLDITQRARMNSPARWLGQYRRHQQIGWRRYQRPRNEPKDPG